MAEGPPDERSLRDLARAHAEGELLSDDYRVARGRLLDRLTADEDPTKPIPTTAATVRLQVAPPAHRGRRISVALGGLAILLVIAAVLLAHLDQPGQGRAARAPGESATPHDTPQRLVESFRNRDDWGQGSVADFLARWEALPADARERGRRSPAFQYLAEDLRRRIDDRRTARNGAGQGEVAALEGLARRLGVETRSTAAPDTLTQPARPGQRQGEASEAHNGVGTTAPVR